MINITNDSDGSICIYGHGAEYVKVLDVVSFVERYFDATHRPTTHQLLNNLPFEGDHAIIKESQEFWGSLWANSTPGFNWLRNNILPLASYINGVTIADEKVQHSALPPTMLNCIVDVSFIQSRNATDILQLIESNETVALQLRNTSTNTSTILNFSPEHVNVPTVDINEVSEQVKHMTLSYRNAMNRITTKKFERFKESFEQMKEAAYLDGMNKGIQMQSAGWRVIMLSGRKYMNYPGRILVETITDYDNVQYQLPKELVGLFWIQDIIVPVGSIIGGASGGGFNPHRTDTNRNHTQENLLQRHSLCLGDLNGAPFNRLPEIVDMYKNINMKSNYGGFATQMCQYLCGLCNNNLNDYLESSNTSDYIKQTCRPALPFYGYFKRGQAQEAGRTHGEVFGDDEI